MPLSNLQNMLAVFTDFDCSGIPENKNLARLLQHATNHQAYWNKRSGGTGSHILTFRFSSGWLPEISRDSSVGCNLNTALMDTAMVERVGCAFVSQAGLGTCLWLRPAKPRVRATDRAWKQHSAAKIIVS